MPFLYLLLLTSTNHPVDAKTEVSCPEFCNCTPDPIYLGVIVNCSSQGLTQLPEIIPAETTTFIFTENNLTFLSNFSFASAPNLRVLNLSGNSISRLEEKAFSGIGNLTKLFLSRNDLRLSPDTYSDDIFVPLKNVEILHINGNSCSGPSFPCHNYSSNASGKKTYLPSMSLKFQTDLVGTRPQRNYVPNNTTGTLINEYGEPKSTMKLSIEEDNRNKEDTLDYPDKALSKLRSLRELHIDGLTNKSLGPGFRLLTSLVILSQNGQNGFCSLEQVTRETFFNVPSMQQLDLTNCNIMFLSDDAFSPLKNLTTLNLSFNRALGFSLLGMAFKGLWETKLHTLVIDAIVHNGVLGIRIQDHHLMYFRNLTYLTTVHSSYNRILTFADGVLCKWIPPSLETVYLNGNPLVLSTYFKDLGCLQNLQLLHVNGYESFNTPPFIFPVREQDLCGFKMEGHSQTLATCLESTSRNLLMQEFVLPPKLKALEAKHCGMFYKLENIPVNPNNSLEHINFADNHFPVWNGPVSGLSTILTLRLPYVSCQSIHPTFFDSFLNLENLVLNGNRLKSVIENDVEGRIFGALKKLKKLYLSRLEIGNIPNMIFRNLSSLEFLDLSVNSIRLFTPYVSHMKNLLFLNLSKNALTSLPETVRSHLDKVAETRNVTLDMTFNPISCECGNLDFLIWMRDSRIYRKGLYSDYFCVQKGNEGQITDIIGTINRLQSECGSTVGILFGAIASCLVVLVVLSMALIYRFRWRLRYLYYASRLSFRRHRCPSTDEFKFDAFLSYSSEDRLFVLGELRSRLEEDFGLKLCIHERDFTPGHYIASNILDAVQCSRHTLVVLTRAFSQSDWCNYELQMALMEGAHTDRDVLLFLLYEDVPIHALSRDILFNIQSHSYIEFPNSEVDKSLFWNRLAAALRN